ncbi:hypothetical protein ACE2AJ_00890 [Aquihabitans daechungensis]|uniref:hypothetical protein n=1 Tax=Aquihabitans daechungensis TaxID=1052257 RepID=UPI003B9FEEC4
MGSTYANVTVVGTGLDAVREALAGTGAHLAAIGGDVVVFSPHDEEQMGGQVTAQQLSVSLGATTVEVVVFDEDFATIHVVADGEVTAAATAPPNGAEIMGEMSGEGAPGSHLTSAETAAALVSAVGRGDAAKVQEALEADNEFASESHHGVFAALDLPTIGVGWGHRYLEQDRELFDAVPLVTA